MAFKKESIKNNKQQRGGIEKTEAGEKIARRLVKTCRNLQRLGHRARSNARQEEHPERKVKKKLVDWPMIGPRASFAGANKKLKKAKKKKIETLASLPKHGKLAKMEHQDRDRHDQRCNQSGKSEESALRRRVRAPDKRRERGRQTTGLT